MDEKVPTGHFLSTSQVAALIAAQIGKKSISRFTVRNMVRDGRLNPPDFQNNGKPYWKRKPVTDWIESGKFLKK